MASIEVLRTNTLCGQYLVEISSIEAFTELVSEIERIIIDEQNGERSEEEEDEPVPWTFETENPFTPDDQINDNVSDEERSSETFSEWFGGDQKNDNCPPLEVHSDEDWKVEEDAAVQNESDWSRGWGPDPQLSSQPFATSDNGWNPEQNRLSDIINWGRSDIAKHFATAGTIVSQESEAELTRLEKKAHRRMDAKRSAQLRKQRLEHTILIDSAEKLATVLDRLSELDLNEPQIVIDCEGFTQEGNIDIMELFVLPDDTLYLIDVHNLQESTWSTTATQSDFCLRTFLTSSHMKKIMWDLRMDAHFLKMLYDIRLAGIIDSSLWTVAYQRSTGDGHWRLSIETACRRLLRNRIDPGELSSLEKAKQQRSRLPRRPWTIRPLPDVLIDYAADVKYMGIIYQTLWRSAGKDAAWMQRLEKIADREIEIVCDRFWPAWSDKGADSPWSSGYFETLDRVLELNREDAILNLFETMSIDIASTTFRQGLRNIATDSKALLRRATRRMAASGAVNRIKSLSRKRTTKTD